MLIIVTLRNLAISNVRWCLCGCVHHMRKSVVRRLPAGVIITETLLTGSISPRVNNSFDFPLNLTTECVSNLLPENVTTSSGMKLLKTTN